MGAATQAAGAGRGELVTPARRLDLERSDGCLLLSAPERNWVDGGEADVAEILAGAADLSSTSDELAAHDATWAQRYHLARERGHIVRPLDLTGKLVLEIGAGCGGVTRRLGEVAAAVDALEPMPVRARAARLRTRDLPGVEVLVGELRALPREPAYDVVVLIGVLEYVGGPGGPAKRVEFLREAVARLRPGGSVVCAIENQLGVKYLAGAPEDHANVPFEGLEGYPRRGPFRTFSRRALEALFAEAGLEATTFGVFPDYKLPRLVYADSLLEGPAAALAWRAPGFPSYDSPLGRPRLASEYRLWRELVEAGLGAELPNSFLVVAGTREAAPLWPAGLEAVLFSPARSAAYATQTRVERDGDGLALRRGYLAPDAGGREGAGLVHRCGDARFLADPPLAELLEDAEISELPRLLRLWSEHAGRRPRGGGPTPLDQTPKNVLLAADGLVDVDEEWWHHEYTPREALERGLLVLADHLANRRRPEDWPEECRTVRDLLAYLAHCAGVDELDGDALVEREARLQAQVAGSGAGDEAAVAAEAARLRTLLESPLELSELGPREHELRRLVVERLTHESERAIELAERNRESNDLLGERQEALDDARREAAEAARDRDAALAELAAREARSLRARLRRLARRLPRAVQSLRWR